MTSRVGGWTPPDGLMRSRPREVRLTFKGSATIAFAGLLWLGAAGAWTGIQLQIDRDNAERRLLVEQGVDADAEVTRLWRVRGEKRQPWVAFRFVSEGRLQERELKVSLSTWNTLKVGGPLAIRYVPAASEICFLRGRGPEPPPAFLPYLASGTLVIVGCLVPLPLICQRRLLSEGRPAQGQVTRHSRDQHGTKVHYEFRTLGGTRAKGKAGPTRKPPPIGSEVCVLYEADRPGSNSLYPLPLVRLVDTRRLGARTG